MVRLVRLGSDVRTPLGKANGDSDEEKYECVREVEEAKVDGGSGDEKGSQQHRRQQTEVTSTQPLRRESRCRVHESCDEQNEDSEPQQQSDST